MALGTTNISTDVVKTAIGSSSDDVGKLCNGSSSDVNTPAFYVAEYTGNGGKVDGELRTEARPKWNIWSGASPGEWFKNVSGYISYRLKRNPYDTTPAYIYGLHHFKSYEHTAMAPELRILENPLKVYLGSNYIPVTFRLDFWALHQLITYHFPTVTHVRFALIINGVSVAEEIKPMPALQPEGQTSYIQFYKEYNNITNTSGYIRCKVTFVDQYDTTIAELGDILAKEVYRSNYDANGKQFPYVDNYDGAWIKQAFNNNYSDTNCNLTGAVDGTGYTIVNGRVLIPTGGYTDGAFVNVTVTRKSTSYSNVSFDIIYDGTYTIRHTVTLQNGTYLLEPNTNSGIAVDGQEHWYTINNITFS